MSAASLLRPYLRPRIWHDTSYVRGAFAITSALFVVRSPTHVITNSNRLKEYNTGPNPCAIRHSHPLDFRRRIGSQCLQFGVCLQSPFKLHASSHHSLQPRSSKSTLPKPDIDLPSLDRKWQNVWRARRSKSSERVGVDSDHSKPKMYILPMFPYPSGNLHMGHLRVYTIADVLSRWKRMSGFNVLSPMGWDAFGLPAENAAIERGVDPSKWTYENISRMKQLLEAMNTNFQWENELSTCDPKFYKHTQRLFLLLRRHRLAYQAEGKVNWDPIDKTVLANEQVDHNGCSWRSGAKVEQKSLKQWYLKVTDFKKQLLEDLDSLSDAKRWPERVVTMQRNWIGRSKGAKVKFLVGRTNDLPIDRRPIEIFTTRPDTLLGVQFLALSPSHPFVTELSGEDATLRKFITECSSACGDSKIGYRLNGIDGINPATLLHAGPSLNCDTIPVFVAPYVLGDYGEGAVMGVPAHDSRDFAFWQTNSPEIPAKFVIEALSSHECSTTQAFLEPGRLNSECGIYAGLSSENAGEVFIEQLSLSGAATYAETWRLRDWLISRQRYWGTPIPIIHCDSCGAVPVPDDQLPVVLPELSGDYFKSKRGNPLERIEEWYTVPCPECGKPAKRDTDTMDTFVDSAWYFFRFPDVHNLQEPFSVKSVDSTLPVDIYIGGVEHAILHLLYARFISKFLASIDMWPNGKKPSIKGEPFQVLISQGMVHGKTFNEPTTGRFLLPHEIDMSDPNNPRIAASGQMPEVTFQKMSKSKYNGVDPMTSMDKFGSDCVRAHVLFAAPVTDILDWDEAKVVGIQRWLKKLWRHVSDLSSSVEASSLSTSHSVLSLLDFGLLNDIEIRSWVDSQRHLQNVIKSYNAVTLNVLISELMKLSHEIYNFRDKPTFSAFLTCQLICAMAPVTPAFAEECWSLLQTGSIYQQQVSTVEVSSIFEQQFPIPDLQPRRTATLQSCAVQENGKFRFAAQIPVLPSNGVPEIEEWVLECLKETVQGAKWLDEKAGVQWKKIIVVRGGKTVNFVS